MCGVGEGAMVDSLAHCTHAITQTVYKDGRVYIAVRSDSVYGLSLWEVIYSLNYIKSTARRVQLVALASPINSVS